jgi:tetratricopeptide (TPR) repeat protein/transcriptional regulator with XRE-family HTH domain
VTGESASDFGGLLRLLRKEAGLTQEELAEEAGLSLRTIQDLEGGRHRTAHKPTAQRLADGLSLTGPAHPLFVRAATGRAPAADVLAARTAAVAAEPVPVFVPRELPADVAAFTGRTGELAALDALLPCGSGLQGREKVEGVAGLQGREMVEGVAGLQGREGVQGVAGLQGREGVQGVAGLQGRERVEGVAGPVVVSAVSGTAGAGKTALAVHWAHRVAGDFPDGQLYVNLRGYDPEQPVPAAEALEGFLGALGLPGQHIPPGEAARAARYRSLLTGRRVLVVLDNAATEEQVRPLLPGSPTAMVVVTSRDSLPGLVARDGARRLDLDLMPADDAVSLLRALIGARVDADPAAAQALAGLCARLPLALRVAAELAASHPDRPLADLVEELADEGGRLDRLDAGGDPRGAVASVLSWSGRHLSADATGLFRRLGLHPGQDWDQYAAAALAGTTLGRARALLATLARTHLIQPAGRAPGRYGLHDLLRAYAAGQAAEHDGEEAGRAALTRLFDYYLAACIAAMDRLALDEPQHRPAPPPVSTPVPQFADPAAARSWLDAELATLVAVAAHTAEHGWPEHTIRLARALQRYLDGVHDSAGLAICGHALQAARACGDRGAQASTLTILGVIYGRQGRYPQATECHQEALVLATQTGDRLTQGWALGNLALIHEQQGRYPQAASLGRRALAIYRALGDTTGEAITLSNLGLVCLRQGRYPQAARHMRQAIGLYRRIGHRFGEVIALTNLGEVSYRQGDGERAAEHQLAALALARELGSRRVEAWALTRLAKVRGRQGRHDEAADGHRRALELFREVGDRDGEAEALNGTGETQLATGQLDRARASHHAALLLTRQTGDRHEQARALTQLGRIYQRQGQPDRAARHLREALGLYREVGDPRGAAEALRLAEAQEAAETRNQAVVLGEADGGAQAEPVSG